MMNAWEHYDLSKSRMRTNRKAMLLAVPVLVIIGCVIALQLRQQSQTVEIVAAAKVETLLETRLQTAVKPTLPNPVRNNNVTTVTMLPVSKSVDYVELIGEVPSLSYVAVQRGPQAVRFTANGNYIESDVNVAQFVSTDVLGAAGEWFVRPWWRLGWIPETADCGEAGTSAIAGHVSWYAQPGPLSELASLVEGDTIECQDRLGEWHQYVVTQRWRTDYNDTDSYYLPPQEGEAVSVLSLYTCTREITGISVIRAELLGN